MKPCGHGEHAGGCIVCDLVAREPLWAAARWGLPVTPARQAAKLLPLVPVPRQKCRHLGAPTGEQVRCETCVNTRLKVFTCGIHTTCTIEKPGAGVPGRCQGCTAYAAPEPPASPAMDLWPGVPDPLPEPEQQPVPQGWASLPEVRDRHVRAFRELLARADLGTPVEAEGDGVVYCGGGRYAPMIAVAVKMLRDVSDLPVQVWHRGQGESPPDLAGLPGVTIVDATTVLPRPRILRGWEIKTLALLHCPWRRVLYLDADAYAVADPAPLLDLAGQNRFVFWKDLSGTAKNVKWPWYGLDGPGDVPQIQGGQLALDRVTFWRELMLAHWLNQHSDYFFSHQFGDQDSYRVALAATGGSSLNLGDAPWRGPAFVCPVAGVPTVVHRCRGKLWGEGKDTAALHLPKEERVFDLLLGPAGTSAAAVFGRIYETGGWGQGDLSGAGSTPPEARPYLDLINPLLRLAGWRRVVDLGAGDGRVLSGIDAKWRVGVECVPARPGWWREGEWHALDLDADRKKLPVGDVALLKDVLHHWPDALVTDWLNWARASGKWKAVLLTADCRQAHEKSTRLGGYRALDLSLRPLRAVPGLREVARYLHKAVWLLDCTPA
jgi:hypothetical protein